MRTNVAAALGVTPDCVSIKGKTNEGVGELGRGEAIAVHAVALVNRILIQMRVRFAPSPTGQLHVGNARTALFNWLLARGNAGAFILRIEDTDVERSTRDSEAAILRDLRWLGLDWDEGPDIGGPCGPYRQSERLHLYESYAKELLAPAIALTTASARRRSSRPSVRRRMAEGRPARYAGTCRRLSHEQAQARIAAGERPAIRFRVPEDRDVVFEDVVRGDVRFHIDVIGDPVIMRADGTPAYNFAVVVDDALMDVTHVVRGEDHISNTPRQILLYEALGFTPPIFAHLSLVMGPDHRPLSKRHGATSVAEFRVEGLSAGGAGQLPRADRLVAPGATAGRSPADDAELVPVDELAQRFSLDARRAERRRVRRGEARVGQPSLPEDGRSACALRSCRCRTSGRPASS